MGDLGPTNNNYNLEQKNFILKGELYLQMEPPKYTFIEPYMLIKEQSHCCRARALIIKMSQIFNFEKMLHSL